MGLLIGLFIKRVFIVYLLCVWHYAGGWESNNELRQALLLMELINLIRKSSINQMTANRNLKL